MAPRLSGQTSIFGVVFFVSKSLLGIVGQKKLEKFAILTRKPRSHARILIYRTWPIAEVEFELCLLALCLFSAECTIGMVLGVDVLKHYGTMGIRCKL